MPKLNSEDIPTAIYEMNENATSFIFNENYEGAVELLEKSILLLKQINASSQVGNALIILLSHHNLALCYQKFFSIYL